MHAVASLLARAVHVTPLGRAYARAASGTSPRTNSARAPWPSSTCRSPSLARTSTRFRRLRRSSLLPTIPLARWTASCSLALVSRVRERHEDCRQLAAALDPRTARRSPATRSMCSAARRRRSGRNGVALRSAISGSSAADASLDVSGRRGRARPEAPDGRILDAAWQHTAADLAILYPAPGSCQSSSKAANSRLFRAAGRIHPLAPNRAAAALSSGRSVTARSRFALVRRLTAAR